MDLGLRGRRAFVAASSSGLGLACAQALAAEGVEVVISGRSPERTCEAARRIGPETKWLTGDLTSPAEASRLVSEAADRLGGLDILIINGPGPRPGTAADFDVGEFRSALESNLLALVAMAQGGIPHMLSAGWGRVLAITSLSVRQPLPGLALSNTARAGATGYLKTLAAEVAANGITVNSLLPGLHATPRVHAVYGDGLDRAVSDIPVRKLGDPEDLGAMAAFLCSGHAGFITGSAILMDGGAYVGLA